MSDITPPTVPDNTPKPGALLRKLDGRTLQIIARDAPLTRSRSGDIDGNSPSGLVAVWLRDEFKAAEIEVLIEEARAVRGDNDREEIRFDEVLGE